VHHPSSYFRWLPLPEDTRADALVVALMRENISVSTAQPFATSAHVPHAIRLALGSVDITTLRAALVKVKGVMERFG